MREFAARQRIMRSSLLAVVLVGCGSTSIAVPGRLPAGQYHVDARAVVRESLDQGGCDYLPAISRDFTVDDRGQVHADGVSCVTTYVEGIEVVCDGPDSQLRVRGVLWGTGGAVLAGDFVGQVSGCGRLLLEGEALRSGAP
jgi:hypothetical protein